MNEKLPVTMPLADEDPPAQIRRFVMIGAAVVLVLGLVWWLFIRTTWLPVLSNIEPQDAADAAKVLESKKIAYRMGDGGSTILVASDAADQARVALAGSELPMRGQVGFELFNQSDMGLTEFAQKINYQRALQGELARTLLTIEGIASVRVHLGLPDRTVFRAEQAPPKASVSLILKPGRALTEATVQGVQKLVAGAIPDMAASAVVVLDGAGRVVSGDSPAEQPASAATSDSDAVIQAWQQEISEAVRSAHPDVQFAATVSLRFAGQGAAPAKAEPETLPTRPPVPRANPDYALAVRITTPKALDDAKREDILHLVSATVGYNAARGDNIAFLTGPLIAPEVPDATRGPVQHDRVVYRASEPAPATGPAWWERWWPAAGVVALAALAAAWWSDRRRTTRDHTESLDDFAQVLRERLKEAEPAR